MFHEQPLTMAIFNVFYRSHLPQSYSQNSAATYYGISYHFHHFAPHLIWKRGGGTFSLFGVESMRKVRGTALERSWFWIAATHLYCLKQTEHQTSLLFRTKGRWNGGRWLQYFRWPLVTRHLPPSLTLQAQMGCAAIYLEQFVTCQRTCAHCDAILCYCSMERFLFNHRVPLFTV